MSYPKLLRILAEQASVPVLIHQDHPDNDQMILRTLRRNYYSVMYDGGHLPLENIKGAAYIAEIAHAMGAAVEAELGQFGGEGHGGRVEKASPKETKRMVEESDIDTLAVSVGSVHGQASRLDLRLLEENRQRDAEAVGIARRQRDPPGRFTGEHQNERGKSQHRGGRRQGVDDRLPGRRVIGQR